MAKDSTMENTPQDSPFNRTAQHDAKRAAILSQAAKLFNTKGSRATTLLDIAQSLGLTKTSLYYYVKTKEELIYQCYMATLDRHHKTLDEVAVQYRTPVERAQAFFRMHFESWLSAEEGKSSHLAALLEIASLKGEHRSRVEARYIKIFKRLRENIRDGIADGSIRPCDSTSVTRAMIGSIDWTFSWLQHVPKDTVPEVAQKAWDVLWQGLSTVKGDYKPATLLALHNGDTDLQGFDRGEQNRLKQDAFYKTGTWFFNKKGFTSTSLDEIADHLNVTKGAFYYHIKNKEDLLFNCYLRSMDIIAGIYADAAKSEATGMQKIDQTCRRIFYFQNSDQGPLIRYSSITALPKDSRRQITQRTDKGNQKFGDFIRQGISDGSVREIDTFVAQNLIAGSINAAMDMQLWRKVDDIDAAAIDYFEIFFNGLKPRK
ncbi:MAG: AcrR family transcriptional regulator [Halioglobus sp.]|jgi:AcrR family transcriptional regulator